MLRIVQTFDDAVALLDWASTQPYVALDTETTGFDKYSPGFAVRLVQFGNTTEAWVVPFAPWVGVVQEVINRARKLVGHNMAFDKESLAQHGVVVPWSKVDDTLIAIRLSEPHHLAALKSVATRLVSRSAQAGQDRLHKAMSRNKWGWHDIPIDYPDYTFYAAMDVILTSRIYEHPTVREGLNSPLYPLEMDVRSVCTTIERNGMRIDTSLCVSEAAAFAEEIDRVQARWVERGVSLTSNGELAHTLLSMGSRLTHVTPSGAPAVTKEALLEARLDAASSEERELIDDALRVRKLQKLRSTYLCNFIDMNVDGLLHPSIETIAAKTGRMVVRSPALQTLPRTDDEDAARIRNMVIPRNDDELLVSCDYAQIELRLIANFSGDKDLQDAFLKSDVDGTDFFTLACRDVYADPSIEKSDPRRGPTKNTFYAAVYGAGVTKMAATAKISVDEMRMVSSAVFKCYPGIKALMKTCEREAAGNDNWITTPMGRRIWVDPALGYKALNAKVQATAGDVFKRALVDLAHAGLEPFMVLPVHDEVLFSIPKDLVDDVRDVIGVVMSDLSWTVPLKAEPSEEALSWATIKK